MPTISTILKRMNLLAEDAEDDDDDKNNTVTK